VRRRDRVHRGARAGPSRSNGLLDRASTPPPGGSTSPIILLLLPCRHCKSADADVSAFSPREGKMSLRSLREATPKLHEHLPNVPLDRAGAEKEFCTNLGVRPSVSCVASNLLLLRRELVVRGGVAFPDLLASGH
jgi:hypothetical protein